MRSSTLGTSGCCSSCAADGRREVRKCGKLPRGGGVHRGRCARCRKRGCAAEAIDAMLTRCFQLANQAVFDQAHLSEEFRGMGQRSSRPTPFKDNITILNVGDSRAYHFQATASTSLRGSFQIAFMVERGELKRRNRPKNHPGKNVITRAVGTGGGRGRPLSPDGAQGRLPAALLRRPLKRDWPIRRLFEVAHGCGGATAAGC